jgi:hypothetical protein
LSFYILFVFNNSLRPTFIFNIFLCAGSLFDFHGQIGNPPHLSRLGSSVIRAAPHAVLPAFPPSDIA